jgi:hypothetical protein
MGEVAKRGLVEKLVPHATVETYPSGPAALDAYFGVQFQGASSPMRLIL